MHEQWQGRPELAHLHFDSRAAVITMDLPGSGFTAAMRLALTTALAQATRMQRGQVLVGVPLAAAALDAATAEASARAAARLLGGGRSALQAAGGGADAALTTVRRATRNI